MRKFAVVVLAVALLTVTFAALPVMAEPTKRIPVTFTRLGMSVVQGDSWYTEGDTYHFRNLLMGFSDYRVTGVGVSFIGTTSSSAVGNLNLKNHVGHMVHHSELVFQEGTFEGIISVRGTFFIVPNDFPVPALRGVMSPYNAVFDAKWHGAGAYQGQTLTLKYETVAGVVPSPLMGYLLVP